MPTAFEGQAPFQYQKISKEEQERRGIVGRLAGIIADPNKPTRNGRHYSRSLWQKILDDPIFNEKIEHKQMFGEIEHPTDGRSEIDPKKIAVCLAEKPKFGKDGYLYGVFDILNTECGRLLKTLLDYGSTFSISSRGDGDVFTNRNGEEEVDPDTYQCFCWDVVGVPGVKEAQLHPVLESVNSTTKKTLKDSLTDLVNNSTDKQTLNEALFSLGINLNESDEESAPQDTNKYQDIAQSAAALDDKYGEVTNVATAKDAFNKAIEQQDSEAAKILAGIIVKYDSEHEDDKKLQKIAENGISSGADMGMDSFEEPIPNIEMTDPNASQELSGDMGAEEPPMDQNMDMNAGIDDLNTENDINQPLPEENPPIMDSYNNTVVYNNMNESSKSQHNHAVDINEAANTKNDGNSMTGMIGVLQETLKLKQDAEAEVVKLNEKLSVCYAKEAAQESQITSLKENLDELKAQAAGMNDLQVKSQTYASKLSEANNSIKSLNNKCKELVEKYNDLAKKYNEGVGKTKSLNENLQNSSTQVTKLKENLSSAEKKIESLTESYTKKLSDAQTLTEKYKRVANTAVNKYISLQAVKLDVTPNEIKNKLPENYSFNDIDRICETLQNQKVSMNMLPFKTHNKLYENMSVQVKGYSAKKETIIPNNSFADDTVDDSLKSLAGM